ncbi:MAG: ferritin [Chloroflexota bacterium]
MLTESTQSALNQQINYELRAYYAYLSMAAHFEDTNLKGFAAWFYQHAQEEMSHAMKFYEFINSRRGRVKLHAVPEPEFTWETPQAVFESALAHEQQVTVAINKLVKMARDEGDFATDSFLQWFVDEQVEEEELVDDILQKLILIGDFKPGLYLLDQELAADAATLAAAEGDVAE